jgi:hypothetical protein
MLTADRFKAVLESIMRRIASRYDFAATYGCKVVSQNADGTLELLPDSPLMPGESGIPIRSGPGVTYQVNPGARVLLTWENCDPSRPIAILGETHDLKSMTITATGSVYLNCASVKLCDSAANSIARVGDMVQVMTGPVGAPSYGTIMTGQPKVTA